MDHVIQFLIEHITWFPVILFLFLSLRYFLISSIMYVSLWFVFSKALKKRRIQEGALLKNQIWNEIRHSLESFAAMSVICTPLFYLYAHGKTTIYHNWVDYPLWWIPINILIFFFWHDWTFYIHHRWLHTPWAYKHIHYVHHISRIPTPFASHAFHWVEGAMQIVFIYPVVMWVPMHPWTFVGFMALSAFFASWGHFNYELMPLGTWHAWWGSWVTTSTHHNLHHKYNNGNFSLYLRSWDRVNGTLHPQTEERYAQYSKKD